MKKRMNIYIKNTNIEKLHDTQYIYRKEKKHKIALSEIINRLLGKLSIKRIIKMITERGE